jgi:hypothetical protein
VKVERLTIALAIVGLACGGDSTAPPGSDGPRRFVSLTPPVAAAAPGAGASFAARDDAGSPAQVGWQVNGIAGGSPSVGTISVNGEYLAPSTFPDGDSVVVTAVSKSDATQRLSSTIFFVPSLTVRNYYVQFPRVMNAASPSKSRVFVVASADVASMTFLHDGAITPLVNVGNGIFMLELDPSVALANYASGALHGLAGQFEYRDASGARVKLTGIGVNVRDAAMPDVISTPVAADAQRSPFVLNLRYDTPLIGASPPAAVVARALQILGDRFDYLAVVANASSNNNRFYASVRNDVQGIGLPLVDNTSAVGSSGRLRGIVNFPLDEFFDPGSVLSHEVGHTWINFASDPLLQPGRPHWPMSSIASESVMGFSIGGPGGEGGQFPFSLVALGNGSYRVESRVASTIFSPWDLYLIGLLPTDSVPPAVILPSTVPFSSVRPGFETPATTYTIAQYVATQGARNPAYGAAPREFALATVVLSYGRLLSPSEMAYFDAAAARIESTTAFPVTTGFATAVPSSPFRVATGGRATLHARLD